MKLLVTGGREYKRRDYVHEVLDQIHAKTPITVVIEGDATGADTWAWEWAELRKDEGIRHDTYTANWVRYSNSAGTVRNCRMLRESHPDLVVAFPGNRGTRHMVRIAKAALVPVIETWVEGDLAKFLLQKE